MKHISFTKGTTIIFHDDLISFLHENDFRILHYGCGKSEFGSLKKEFKKLSRRIPNADIFGTNRGAILDSIIEAGFAEYLNERDRISDEYEILEFETPQILHVLVVLTNKCNMRCKYCYAEANGIPNDEEELSAEEWIKLFQTIKIPGKYRTQNLSFTGGEPTIYPAFIDILTAVSGKYKIEMSSNGLDVDKNLLEALEKAESLNFINISMDSYEVAEDEFMRGNGTYARRLKNIRELYGRGIRLCFSVVVNSVTVNSLEETTAFFLEEFPGASIKYIPLTRVGLATHLDRSLFLSERQSKEYLSILFRMKERYQEKVLGDPSSFNKERSKLHWSGRCSHMKIESERDLHFYSPSNKYVIRNHEKCNAAYGVVAISPSGRMRPCLRPDSFYEDMFTHISKETLMPCVKNANREEIGSLPFWQIVKQGAFGFNPLETCALKHSLDKKGGNGNGLQKSRAY